MSTFQTRAGGLVFVAYSTNGGSTWLRLAGRILAAEGLSVEAIKQEHTSGEYQSGDKFNPKITLGSFANYDVMRNFAVGANRTAVRWAFQYPDGRWTTSEDLFPIVTPMGKSKRSEGDNGYIIELHGEATTMLNYTAGQLSTSAAPTSV